MENTNHKLLLYCEPITAMGSQAVFDTIKNILNKFGYKCNAIGSFGKKKEGELYNDIDIAIEADWDVRGNVIAELVNIIDGIRMGNVNQKLHVINIAFPYDEKKYVQVDFMFVKKLNYAEFAYHSPDFSKNESKYKGMYASTLLMAALKNIHPYLHSDPETGNIIEWEYYSLSQSDGLYIKRKSLIGVKGKRIKTPRLIEERFISNDPDEILWTVFGWHYPTGTEVYTFEGLLNYLYDWHLKEWSGNRSLAKDYFEKVKKDFLTDWQFEMKTPDELKKEFEDLFNQKINSL